jgi:hypothetical protein
LALILIESLDPGTDNDVDAAWREVALKRAREMDEGLIRAIPAEEVFANLYRTLSQKHS